MGDFHVIEALATLAWEGRRASFFRGELMAALHILEHGDVTPAHMLGSYAGAMGQPQFMPSSFLRYAVDFDGTGRRDIWTSKSDVLGSIANYLAQSGWRAGEPWGRQVTSANGAPAEGKLLQPDGPAGPSFVVYGNFNAIRRYNPSDFYALAVGLLGDSLVA